MQPVTNTLASLLALSSRRVVAEVLVQFPNPANNLQASSQILMDGVTKLTVTRNEEMTSDTIDLEVANGDGRYTPIRSPGNFIPMPS